MLIEEEESKEAPAKTGSNWKNNNENKDKKASNSKEVYAVNLLIESIPIGTTYTQTLEWLMTKEKIVLLNVKPETKALRQSKRFDLSKRWS